MLQNPHARMRYSTQHVPTIAKFHKDNTRNRIVLGPVGSGKSLGMVVQLWLRAMNQAPNQNGVRKTRMVCVRNTYPLLRSTTIETFQHWLPQDVCRLTSQRPILGTLKCPHPDGVSTVEAQFWFLALDRVDDRDKLLSLEPTMIWWNELREIPFELVSAASERPGRYPPPSEGGATFSGMIGCSNHPPIRHWLRDFEINPPKGWKIYRQPPALIALDDEYKRFDPNPNAENIPNLNGGYNYYFDMIETKRKYDPESITVQILAQYGSLSAGRPVFRRSFNPQIHVSPTPLKPEPNTTLRVALDFGSTPAATFAQLVHGQLRILHTEHTESATGTVDFFRLQILPAIAQRFPNLPLRFSGDPSGQTFQEAAQASVFHVVQTQLGITIYPAGPRSWQQRASDPRHDALRAFMTSLPQGQPGLLIDPQCELLIDALSGSYQYAPTSAFRGEQLFSERPRKNLASHTAESACYCALDSQITLSAPYSGEVNRTYITNRHKPATSAGY